MARVIPQRVYWLGSLAEAHASLQPCIDAFLAAANRGRQSPPNGAPFDALAHRLLVALHSGRRFGFQFAGWPPWFYLAFLNIDSNVRSGDYHLRPCCVRGCGHWMLVKSAARKKCNRLACRRIEERRRQAKFREHTEGTIARARA